MENKIEKMESINSKNIDRIRKFLKSIKDDDVECRDYLCKIEVISLPKEDNNES